MNNILIQKLKNFPQQIHAQEMQVLNCYNQKQACKSDLDSYLLGIDDRIAQNPEYKNELQRKTAKHNLISQSDIYCELNQKLLGWETNYKTAQINLEKIKREYSVAKLEIKLAIADSTPAA